MMSSVLVVCAVAAQAAVNLVENPSFEEWPDGAPLPTGWSSPDRRTLTNKVFRCADVADDGRYAVRFTNARCGNMLQQHVKVTPGRYYNLSCRAKTAINYMEFRMGNHWETPGGKFVHNVTKLSKAPNAMGTTDWHTIEVRNLRAPDGVDRLVIDLIPNDSHSGNDVPGSIWVDSVCVTEADVSEAGADDGKVATDVPLAKSAGVTVDGEDSEPVWRTANVISRLVSPTSFSPEGAQTSIRLAADREAVYLFARMDRISTSTPPPPRADRDAANLSDVLEFYFKTDMRKDRQFHFVADGAGNLWDFAYTYCTEKTMPPGQYIRATRDEKWNAKGFEHAVRDHGTHWTLECRIPYADLEMATPGFGTSVLANFARGDYGKTGVNAEQLSQWCLQKTVDFADWRDWGRLTFVRPNFAVNRIEIEPGNTVVGASFSAFGHAAGGRIVVEEIGDDGAKLRLGEAAFALRAGETKAVSVPLVNKCALAWISVYDGDRLVYRRGGRPAGKSLMITMRDLENVRKKRIFIPNDTRWYNVFVIDHNLTGKTGCKIYGNPTNLNAHIWAETPPGVTIPFMMYSTYGAEMPQLKPLSETKFTKEGRAWTRYELPVYISGVNDPHVFFQTDLPEGATGEVVLYMTWDGGEQLPTAFPFKVVSFGRVKPFKRLALRMDDLTMRLASAICDDPAKELPTLGMNVWKVPLFPARTTTYFAETKERYVDRFDRLVREMKASGHTWYFSVQNELNDALRFWCNRENYGNPLRLTPDPDAQFIDISGRPKFNTWGWVTICPSYRGTNFEAQVKGVLESDAVKKYGVTWFVIDWEFWGDDPCYCPRCLGRFRDYCARRKLPDFGDPREFMKDELAHPEAAKAFRDSYWEARGAIYADFRTGLNRGLDPNRTEWCAPKKGCFSISEWTRPKPHLLAGIDTFDWSVGYHAPGPRLNGFNDVFTNVLKGASEKLAFSLSSMQSCEMNISDPPISTYYNMMEAASAGTRGFEYWWSPVWEAESWKYVMDGLKMMRPFEDIVLDGKVTVHERGENCVVRRNVLGDEALCCVRNYDLKSPQEVAFMVRVRQAGEVWDLTTGRKVADVKPGANKIRVALDPDHLCKLYYVGSGYGKRQADLLK